MTYLEKRRNSELIEEPIINWVEFFKKETYSMAELMDADESAAHWVTCACGNEDSNIPRTPLGEPRDRVLLTLGLRFSREVELMRMTFKSSLPETFITYKNYAYKTLQSIQQRAIEIINTPPELL